MARKQKNYVDYLVQILNMPMEFLLRCQLYILDMKGIKLKI